MARHLRSLGDLRRAAQVLERVVSRTPLQENPDVRDPQGRRLLLKPESIQRTGAFKRRGACHRLRHMTQTKRSFGVVCYASGNYALGLAQAARITASTGRIEVPPIAHPQIFAGAGTAALGDAGGVLDGQIPVKGRSVASFVTGGNIDPARFANLLETPQ